MMAGALGAAMWAMMGLMIAAMAGGVIAWARRRLGRQTVPPAQPERPGDGARPPGPADRDTPE
jgi:hypothetical protein